jgi:hypothetical protein
MSKNYTDGFRKKNEKFIFDKEFCKWIRRRRNSYSHLHGSFLFREEESSVEKLSTSLLDKDTRTPLIILTANNVKYQKIHKNSDENFILHVYNYHFVQSLCQSNLLTIIGYGFMDEYLNNDIKYALAKNPKLLINLICRDQDEQIYKERLKLPPGIKKERIQIQILNDICDVTSKQLANFR